VLLTVPLYLLFMNTTGMAHFRIVNRLICLARNCRMSFDKFENLLKEITVIYLYVYCIINR